MKVLQFIICVVLLMVLGAALMTFVMKVAIYGAALAIGTVIVTVCFLIYLMFKMFP
jgi:hypothetical protein